MRLSFLVILEAEQDGTKIPESIPADVDNRRIQILPYATYDIPGAEYNEEDHENAAFEFSEMYHLSREVAYAKGLDFNDWVYDEAEDDLEDLEEEEEWEYWDEVSCDFLCNQLNQ